MSRKKKPRTTAKQRELLERYEELGYTVKRPTLDGDILIEKLANTQRDIIRFLVHPDGTSTMLRCRRVQQD